MSELKIHNTLTRCKEVFIPREEGKVRMYVCGITAYDFCHLGHARCYVAFDAVYRWLKHLGYQVTYVQNITDLDDKLIKRAREEGAGESDIKERVSEIAEKFTAAYFEDMARLSVLRADFYPRATEYVAGMVRLIKILKEKGFAYNRAGNVYFEVARFPEYGRLSGRDVGELLAGARVKIGEDKKNPLDFALWKRSAAGEPSWPSPWGEGRPGWHIECSAMSMDRLGPDFDLHGGGQDLIFPHHENEIAQSEAATSRRPARYWLHNGFVTIKQEKMSKSLQNVSNLRDLFRVYPPRVIRFFLLGRHYRSPVDYTEEGLAAAGEALARLDNCYSLALERWGAAALEEADPRAMEECARAMNDDFNTAGALAVAHRLAGEFFNSPEKTEPKTVGAMAGICGILGIELENRLVRIAGRGGGGAIDESELERLLAVKSPGEEEIAALVKFRQALRRTRRFSDADRIRERLAAAGIEIRDNPDGSTTIERIGNR